MAARNGRSTEAYTLWDNCSTRSYITFDLANRLDLKGTPVIRNTTVFGNHKDSSNSYIYTMFAYDTDKKKVRFDVVGVKTIAKLTDKKQRVALNNTFTETANNNLNETEQIQT